MPIKDQVKHIQRVVLNNAKISRMRALRNIHELEPLFVNKKCINSFKNALSKSVQIRSKSKRHDPFHRVREELKSQFINPSPFINAANNTAPTINDIGKEIKDLKKEFDNVMVCDHSNKITVETKPITINQINFGKFLITLDISILGNTWLLSDFQIMVMALAPNYPKNVINAEFIVHPHVMREKLCKGEAASALTSAVIHTRIFDYFFMINAILENYSSAAPFASIEKWEDSFCEFCAKITGSKHTKMCVDCEQFGCDNCIRYCDTCSSDICASEHSSICDNCWDIMCSVECALQCSVCCKSLCKHCISEH